MQNDSLDWYKIYGNTNEHEYWYLMSSQNRVNEYGEILTYIRNSCFLNLLV